MLKGEAKRAYQREYMRTKRSNKTPVRPTEIVRPNVRPEYTIIGGVRFKTPYPISPGG